ncbi:Uncharacterized protein MLTONO_0236 [Mesorhizobium loti]|nr:Uncharacterized protein MLTONO_0236 [Mesorhizobium loti]
MLSVHSVTYLSGSDTLDTSPPIDGVEEGREPIAANARLTRLPFPPEGERWRCEAATDWGKPVVKRTADGK